MSENFWLWAWGAVGAVIFAGPVLALKLTAVPGEDAAADHREHVRAIAIAVLAILTGAVSAQAFAGVAQEWASKVVHLPLPASALIVGVSANFLWPKIVRRMGRDVDGTQTLPGGPQ